MSESLRAVSLLFLERDDQILLAMKKRGFGAGRWNGVGGKPEPGEDIRTTAVRETQEEIGVTPIDFTEVGELHFYFPEEKKDWNQLVRVFMCSKWEGEPTESEEMAPEWYEKSHLPYDEMWADDEMWLPEVLAGNYVEATFYFEENENMVKRHTLTSRPLA
ncbi:MAG TPA: 8-oxo-dGTP diphosphatase [Candidatus Saccharimonadales bacterium]|jgi:8-oxo-dGTP pyrophosphatase MutT (NUDIX family)|nr:8-oxo-dGTP diphosphatase [Candidatus Saccharimonadales bacterium]